MNHASTSRHKIPKQLQRLQQYQPFDDDVEEKSLPIPSTSVRRPAPQIKSMSDSGDTEKLKRTRRAGGEAASKKTKTGVSTLSDAFELVEKQKRLNSLTKARDVLNQVRPFRPAVDVLAGKVKESLLDDESEDDLSQEDRDTYIELSAAKNTSLAVADQPLENTVRKKKASEIRANNLN